MRKRQAGTQQGHKLKIPCCFDQDMFDDIVAIAKAEDRSFAAVVRDLCKRGLKQPAQEVV